ncbi:hypothetical protein AGMMS49525_04310 [Bacteroidia bacterium]|nr:hypothetical protein AGMMS49525_04310 [Bacteroidia bacterium]
MGIVEIPATVPLATNAVVGALYPEHLRDLAAYQGRFVHAEDVGCKQQYPNMTTGYFRGESAQTCWAMGYEV